MTLLGGGGVLGFFGGPDQERSAGCSPERWGDRDVIVLKYRSLACLNKASSFSVFRMMFKQQV